MKLKQLIVLIFILLFSGFCYAGDCIVFVSENYPDGSQFSINESFTKKWQVKNCGSTAWKNYKLVYAGRGKDINLSDVKSVDIPDTKAGGLATIKVKMTAPSTSGTYKSTWKAHNSSDKAFGNPSGKITGVWAIINVEDTSNPTNGNTNPSGNGNPSGRTRNPVAESDRECTVKKGNPIDTATGSQDYKLNLLSVSGLRDINFVAHYSSLVFSSGSMGTAWGHNYETSLEEYDDQSVKIAWRNNREDLYDKQADGSYKSLTKEAAYNHLEKNTDGTFVLTLKNKAQYFFDTTGRLLKDTNPQGQTLIYTHNDSGFVTEVREPVSGVYLQFNYDANLHLSSVNDPLGRKVEFSYDDEGRIISYSNALGQKMTYTLNSKGQVISAVNPEDIKVFTNTFDEQDRIFYQKRTRDFSPDLFAIDYSGITGSPVYPIGITDHLGNKQTVVYQDEYVIKEITDELGNKTQIEYDDNNNPIRITDAKGRVTEQTFDAKGNLTLVKNPLGHVAMTYDGNDDLVSYTDARGNVTQFTYDDKHNALTKTDAAGKTTKLTYTAEGKIATITSPAGRTTRYDYQNGRVSKIIDPQGYITKLAYDAAGRLTSATDGDGFTTTLVLDNLDRVIQVIDPLGNKTQNSYDSRGNILTTTDPNGNTTSFAYDGNTNLIKTTNALGAVTGYEYDANDRIIKITDAKGNATTLTYDAKGRVIKTTDALGNTETAEYDATDQLIKNLDPLGQETLYNYNQIDHLIKVTNALNKSAQFDYDKNSNVIAVTDPLERKTINSYDALNRLIENTDALAGKARQGYDDDGHLTAMTDPNNNQTSFTVNPRGLISSETTAAGRKLQFDYNGRGLVTKVINGRKQLKTIVYDGAGRVIKTTDPVGTTRYSYDKNGNLLKTIAAHGTISRQYDALNRIIAYTNTAGEKIQYQYDANDNLTALIYPSEIKSHHDDDDDSDDNKHRHHRHHRHRKPMPMISKQVTYSYDALNRMTKVVDWANRVTRYEYDANSRLIKTTRPNGSVETRRYNSINQLVELKDVSRHNQPIYQVNYEYDAVGNIIKEEVQPDSRIKLPESTTLTYSADNRIKRFSDKTIEFDADGNMTKAPLRSKRDYLRFNARNQLVSALRTTYRYDAEGYRTHQNSHHHGIRYTVNPEAVLSQVLIEHHDSKNTYYVYGLGLIGQEANKHYQSYHFDYRGSTVALTNNEGHETERYSYTPFGDVSDHEEDDHKASFKYNGRDGVITDANGLYYMRARYYSPELHRFVSQDVLLGEVESSQSLNRYGYVEGNPVAYTDPTGNCPWCVLAAYGAIQGVIEEAIDDYMEDGKFNNGLKNYGKSALGGAVSNLVLPGSGIIKSGLRGLVSQGIKEPSSSVWDYATNAGYEVLSVSRIIKPFISQKKINFVKKKLNINGAKMMIQKRYRWTTKMKRHGKKIIVDAINDYSPDLFVKYGSCMLKRYLP